MTSFLMISASPDARDMIGGYNALGKAETKRAMANKIEAWTEVLVAHMEASAKLGLSAAHLAEYIVISSIGLRDQASNAEQLQVLLEVQKQGLLAQVWQE